MSEVSDTLRAARKLIEKPENWCKGANARDAQGLPTYETGAKPCQWCVEGAVYQVFTPGRDDLVKIFDALARAAGEERCFVPDFNDAPDTTHPMVLDLFDRAIEMEEAG